MVSDILLAKGFDTNTLYFIFMNPDPQLIDVDWEDIRKDYYKNKGIDLKPTDKKDFTVIFSINNGYIWIKKESLFKHSRPLMRSEIGNKEFSILNNVGEIRARYINNEHYYINVFDFLEGTDYKPNR